MTISQPPPPFWTPPAGPPPRECYTVIQTPKRVDARRRWSRQIAVWRLDEAGRPETQVAEYVRDYDTFFDTFEPFRQDGHDYALIAPHPAAVAVLDLESGDIIARQVRKAPAFYLTQFYVPDWRDVHDAPPYTAEYSPEYLSDVGSSAPRGDFGFTAGCEWGDDTSWKLRYIDLSRIREGIVEVDDRFGDVELQPNLTLQQAVYIEADSERIEVAVRTPFNATTGALVHSAVSVDD